MRLRRVHRAVVWALGLALLSCLLMVPPLMASGPERVVILPFTANSKEDVSFLVRGVRDMLATRLSWQDKVTVVEPDLVAPAAAKIKPPYNEDKARQLGKELNAQVVVFGSLTVVGQSVSVDAALVKVAGDAPPLTAYVQTSDLDSVIPRINDFAQRINAEVFQRPEALAALKKSDEASRRVVGSEEAKEGKAMETAEGEALEKLPENMSPLNPLFLKTLSGVDSDRYWRSPRINGTITSVAVGDVDGDGKNELLVLLPDSLRVYRLAGEHFALIHEYKNGPSGIYLYVDVADIAHTGRPQVFVSNLNNKLADSFVLQWQEGGLRMISKPQNIYYRTQPKPGGKGSVLYGQRTAVDSPFFGPVWEMKWDGKDFVPDKEITMPRMGNVFNFAMVDLNGSGKGQMVMVGHSYDLRVFTDQGDMTWSSAESYGATGKYIPFTAASGSGYEEVWWYLPGRIIPVDMHGDGRQEVVVVRNMDRADGLLDKMRMFYQGTIYDLYWNGMQLVENWRTPNISGYLPDYAVGDVGNVGRPALIMAVGQRSFKGWMEADTSHVVAFTLKPQKKPPRQPKGL
ncbi:MAG: VCBS repeat-containing protein [Desulfarculus sp.]|nr:VCBS repeat-containing protein [Desulfarculus sp.]